MAGSQEKMEGTWKQFKGRIQEAWGSLTGDQLDKFEGKRDQLIGYIQQKTGETQEEIERQIEKIQRKIDSKL